jgi:hypothetical protein
LVNEYIAWGKALTGAGWLTILKPLLSSTTALTLVFLVLFDAALVAFRPLQYIHDLRFIPLDQHPMVSKIPVYMESNRKIDVLVLGSSLPMCAIAEYDEKIYGKPNCKDITQLRRYLGAKYLEQQLSSKLARPINAANLSIVACMASDMYIILSKSIAAGKRPDVAVLCIAPRDFVDNLVQPIGRTPPFEVLQDWKSLGDVLRRDMSAAETRDLLISAAWYYYRVKVDYRTVLTQYFSNLVSHPVSLYYATHPSETAVKRAEVKICSVGSIDKVEADKLPAQQAVMDSSKGDRYRPPNFKRFALEIDFFRKLLALCKKENIECVVVNMPMSVAHRSILDKRLDRQYVTETQNACVTYGAHYFDFNDQQFVDSDFNDGFHVNASGAEKVMKRMVASYESLPTLTSGVDSN